MWDEVKNSKRHKYLLQLLSRGDGSHLSQMIHILQSSVELLRTSLYAFEAIDSCTNASVADIIKDIRLQTLTLTRYVHEFNEGRESAQSTAYDSSASHRAELAINESGVILASLVESFPHLNADTKPIEQGSGGTATEARKGPRSITVTPPSLRSSHPHFHPGHGMEFPPGYFDPLPRDRTSFGHGKDGVSTVRPKTYPGRLFSALSARHEHMSDETSEIQFVHSPQSGPACCSSLPSTQVSSYR